MSRHIDHQYSDSNRLTFFPLKQISMEAIAWWKRSPLTGLKLRFCDFLYAKSRFSPFKNCFWRKEWRKNSKKKFEFFFSFRPTDRVSTCRYRCINRPEIAFFVARIVTSFELQKLFLEKKWKKNSGKNSICSSHLDLSIVLLKFEFRALGGPESHDL